MSSTHPVGHGGRARALRGAFGAVLCVGLALTGTGMTPAPASAQNSLVLAGLMGPAAPSIPAASTRVVPGAPLLAIANAVLAAHASELEGAGAEAEVEAAALSDAELLVQAALATADLQVGTRYRWGGTSPGVGFDCSGFVQYVFGQQGVELPRVAREQARVGERRPTSLEDLAPGDLLFFAQRGPGIDHVAIYAGDGRIIHASHRGAGVRYDDLSGDRGRWYLERLRAVRRVISDDGTQQS